MGSLGTEKDWTAVLLLALVWGVTTFIFSRWFPGSNSEPIPSLLRANARPTSRVSVRGSWRSILILAFFSFDVGFLETFKQRSLHGPLLLIFVGVNLALIALRFRLLPHSEPHRR